VDIPEYYVFTQNSQFTIPNSHTTLQNFFRSFLFHVDVEMKSILGLTSGANSKTLFFANVFFAKSFSSSVGLQTRREASFPNQAMAKGELFILIMVPWGLFKQLTLINQLFTVYQSDIQQQYGSQRIIYPFLIDIQYSGQTTWSLV
jgi:hypothetical protein